MRVFFIFVEIGLQKYDFSVFLAKVDENALLLRKIQTRIVP